jgi:hypothetical protein
MPNLQVFTYSWREWPAMDLTGKDASARMFSQNEKKRFKIDLEPLFMCLAVTHVLPRANGHFF